MKNITKNITKNTVLAVIIYIIWVIGFAVYSYKDEKKELYQYLDRQLEDAAIAATLAIPKDLHQKGMSKRDLTKAEDMELIKKLSKYTESNNIAYIYTLILIDNKIYFTSSSGTREEIKTGKDLVHYFDYYDDADPRVYDIFKTKEKKFLEYTDKWGTFRSVFIPVYSPDGTFYLAVADHNIEYIQKNLNYHLVKTLVTSALFLLFAYPVYLSAVFKIREYAKSLEQKVEERTRELWGAKKEAEIQARTDVLTGLNNRRAFFEYLTRINSLSRRNGATFSILLIDLDYFKKINDTYGHHGGDEALRKIGDAIKMALRDSDISARIGGEEFACIFPETTKEDAMHLAQRIHRAIRDCRIHYEGKEFSLTSSIGVAARKDPEESIDSVIRRADDSLYQAKEMGRDTIFTVE